MQISDRWVGKNCEICGLGDAASHIVFDNVMFYMPFFYTDISGGETQSPQTLRWIIALFTLFPAACYALSALAAGKYRLRRAEMATIAATLHP